MALEPSFDQLTNTSSISEHSHSGCNGSMASFASSSASFAFSFTSHSPWECLRGIGYTLNRPQNALTVVSGVSGSGKSSLAFDTVYAEGQRRYVESLSAYARQFLERIEKP